MTKLEIIQEFIRTSVKDFCDQNEQEYKFNSDGTFEIIELLKNESSEELQLKIRIK